MNEWDAQLELLCRQAERKTQLEDRIRTLRSRHDRLAGQIWDLEQRKAQEREDVERLEKGGLVAFFYNLTGKLDEKLYKARQEIEMLQSQLRSFQSELADVTVRGEISVEVDDFLRFADYFFDGLFADWAVMDRINESKRQVEGTVGEITDALERLHELANKTEDERAEAKAALEQYIRETACP